MGNDPIELSREEAYQLLEAIWNSYRTCEEHQLHAGMVELYDCIELLEGHLFD